MYLLMTTQIKVQWKDKVDLREIFYSEVNILWENKTSGKLAGRDGSCRLNQRARVMSKCPLCKTTALDHKDF